MRDRVNAFLLCGALVTLQALWVPELRAASGEERPGPEESRWVPSFSIISGVTLQKQDGSADSELFEGANPDPVPLRGPVNGDSLPLTPFVGGSLELMTPALAIPTRPRLFVSGEILPSFGAMQNLVTDGDPGCIRGPEPDSPCARDEDGSRRNAFFEDSANGKGSKTTTEVQELVYGASVGLAFPASLGERRLWIRPSFGWISYRINATGLVVDARCDPNSPFQCTATTSPSGVMRPGFLREMTLSGSSSERFDGIGPGLDIEVDTGRFGPIGSSLLLGIRAYHILGDRQIAFGASQSYDDVVGMDTAVARFRAEVNPWLYRTHVGIRFQWLGGSWSGGTE